MIDLIELAREGEQIANTLSEYREKLETTYDASLKGPDEDYDDGGVRALEAAVKVTIQARIEVSKALDVLAREQGYRAFGEAGALVS